jgi:hypothetical protein
MANGMDELGAFPSSIWPSVLNVVAELPRTRRSEPSGRFTVSVEGEGVRPERIYNAELPRDVTSRWERAERNVYACLYTRHHDGYTRQRHLRSIVNRSEPWVAPFVVRLIGEYVVEILHDIQTGLPDLETAGSAHRTQYATFAAANPGFMALTAARVTSYWDCYYRHDYPRLSDYPGFQLISSLRRIAALDD